jgi:uncharacterized protein YprB with RNaseH-like and TPR domain
MFLYQNVPLCNRDLLHYYNQDTYQVVFPKEKEDQWIPSHRLASLQERIRECNLSTFPFSQILKEFPFLLFIDAQTHVFLSDLYPSINFSGKSILLMFSDTGLPYKLDFFLYFVEHFKLSLHFETDYFYRVSDKIQKIPLRTEDRVSRMRTCLDYLSNLKKNQVFMEHFPRSLSLNMKCSDNVEKQDLAIKQGEVTLFPGITLRVKEKLRNSNIFSFYQTHFLEQLELVVSKNYYSQTKRMMELLQTKSNFSISQSLIEDKNFLKLVHNQNGYVFFDFEYTSELIYMVGLYVISFDTSVSYYIPLVSQHRTNDTLLFKEFLKYHELFRNYVWIFYRAEHGRAARWFRENHKILEADHWVDLCTLMQDHCAFRNCFNYKLKSIVKFLSFMNEIEDTYDGACQNGMESIELFNEYHKTRNLQFLRIIQEYNEKDCRYLHAIVEFLLKNINKKSL